MQKAISKQIREMLILPIHKKCPNNFVQNPHPGRILSPMQHQDNLLQDHPGTYPSHQVHPGNHLSHQVHPGTHLSHLLPDPGKDLLGMMFLQGDKILQVTLLDSLVRNYLKVDPGHLLGQPISHKKQNQMCHLDHLSGIITLARQKLLANNPKDLQTVVLSVAHQ